MESLKASRRGENVWKSSRSTIRKRFAENGKKNPNKAAVWKSADFSLLLCIIISLENDYYSSIGIYYRAAKHKQYTSTVRSRIK